MTENLHRPRYANALVALVATAFQSRIDAAAKRTVPQDPWVGFGSDPKKPWVARSKYRPHQGRRECARRVRQREAQS